MITHLGRDILECKVRWALESITMNKASGGDGIPVALFQILEDNVVKVLHVPDLLCCTVETNTGLDGEGSACNVRHPGSVLGWGRWPVGGKGYPL